MNAINLIVPYRYQGMWVFDDARVGLDKEPFVSGADTMIDVLVREIPNAQKGFRLLFSATPFPGYQVKLEWAREELRYSSCETRGGPNVGKPVRRKSRSA